MSARPGDIAPHGRAPLDAPALLDALRGSDAGAAHSPLGRTPWLYLHLDDAQAAFVQQGRRLLPWLRTRACPVIGLTESPAASGLAVACDVVVASDAEAQSLLDNIERTPLAAMTLVQVLRATELLPITQGLMVESLGYATLQAGPEFRDWLASSAKRAAQPESQGAPLRLERVDSRLTITLARPERRNALSLELRDSLVEAFELVAGDAGIESAIVQGEGPDFCSGGDLAEFGTAPDPSIAHAVRSVRLPAAALVACRDRVSFRLHGACIGAGAELAAFGREVTATHDTYFRLPELSFGLIPGAGGCVSVARRIGRQRTALLALSGRRLDAVTAQAWGLVDSIV
jgi:enoyl-CoA hydratase